MVVQNQARRDGRLVLSPPLRSSSLVTLVRSGDHIAGSHDWLSWGAYAETEAQPPRLSRLYSGSDSYAVYTVFTSIWKSSPSAGSEAYFFEKNYTQDVT